MTDIEIAQAKTLQPIAQVAAKIGLSPEQLEPYGHYKAKLNTAAKSSAAKGKLILVSAITPTPPGEGKTTTSIGLTDGLNALGKKALAVLREPSLGPVFGMKGGATGGGHAQVLPMEDINLHFTGDFAAIEKAHNLLAALVENHLHFKNTTTNLNPKTVVWKRVMDMNDRSLRQMVTGLGGTGMGVPREAGFDITAASEVMAILCLAKNFSDLKKRLGNIFIGYSHSKKPLYAKDFKAEGAMAALLKDAFKPNLVQTLEGNPVLIHGGPFANIAQGTNTVAATQQGLNLADYVVTEAGFGFDLGGEKFMNIKCREAGLEPDLVVMVATIRALKYHGGAQLKELETRNMPALQKGLSNLDKHLENVAHFGLPAVVAVNRFKTDTDEELQLLKEYCQAKGVRFAEAKHWAEGGAGALNLALTVVGSLKEDKASFKFTYANQDSIKAKIEAVAEKIYGAAAVELSAKAQKDIARIEALGLGNLPVCIAKTQYSFSDDPKKTGRPAPFTLAIREVELAAGAGFCVPIAGAIMRMPGLPRNPAAENIDVSEEGQISGLY
jgi:formate--tetrahydrofolate ligase